MSPVVLVFDDRGRLVRKPRHPLYHAVVRAIVDSKNATILCRIRDEDEEEAELTRQWSARGGARVEL